MALVEAVYLTLALVLTAFLGLSMHMRARYPDHAHLPWMIAAIGAMAATLLVAAAGSGSSPGLALMVSLFTASAALTCKTFAIMTGAAKRWPATLPAAAALTALTCWAVLTGYPYKFAIFPSHLSISLLMGEAAWMAVAQTSGKMKDHVSRAITLCLVAMSIIFTARGLALMALFDVSATFTQVKQTGFELATMLAMALPGMTMTVLMIFRTVDQTADQYRAAARTDGLTGLMNRSAFVDATNLATDGAWLIVCDIDHFKRVNDSWGHAAGDMALRCFSGMLRGVNMACGRIGGEEFAIFLPFATEGQARLIAEGLRTAFSLRQIDGLPADMRLTASFGIAGWVEGDTFDTVFKRADTALYCAKAEGRDRVAIAAQSAECLPTLGLKAA